MYRSWLQARPKVKQGEDRVDSTRRHNREARAKKRSGLRRIDSGICYFITNRKAMKQFQKLMIIIVGRKRNFMSKEHNTKMQL